MPINPLEVPPPAGRSLVKEVPLFRPLWLLAVCCLPLWGMETREPAASRPSEVPIFSTRDLRLRFRVEEQGAADIARFLLHFTLDGGQTWTSTDAQSEGPWVSFRAPQDGRYGIKLSAVDAVGAASAAPAASEKPDLEAIVDTTGPAVRVIRPNRLESVASDGRVEIEWEVRDENLGPTPLELSSSIDRGPWETIWNDLSPQGRRDWHAPLMPGEVRLRFRASDLAGNSTVIITPDVYRVVADHSLGSKHVASPPYSRSRRVPIYYRLQPDPEGKPLAAADLRKVQIWYRESGIQWVKGNEDDDRSSPMSFQAQRDGIFDILVVAIDRQGRTIPIEAAPGLDGRPDHNLAAHARCLVDTKDPVVTIESPTSGSWVEAGQPLSITYAVEDANLQPDSVLIASSLDGGRTWVSLAEGLHPEEVLDDGWRRRGVFSMNLPRISSENFLIRVDTADRAGNTAEARTDLSRAITIRGAQEDPNEKAEEIYRRGVLQFNSTDPTERQRAIESFRRALLYVPDHAAANHDLGAALEQLRGASPAALGGPNAEDPVALYRRAYTAASSQPRYAFSLVAALLKRAEGGGGEPNGPLRREAEKVFEAISWSRLVEIADQDRDESHRLRKLYRLWKDRYFNRLPR